MHLAKFQQCLACRDDSGDPPATEISPRNNRRGVYFGGGENEKVAAFLGYRLRQTHRKDITNHLDSFPLAHQIRQYSGSQSIAEVQESPSTCNLPKMQPDHSGHTLESLVRKFAILRKT